MYNFKYLSLIILIIQSSCLPYRIPTTKVVDETIYSASPLYYVIPRHRTQIYPLDLGHLTMWALFGNDDDGIFGEGPHANYKPHCKPSLGKAVFWWFRNPLHNFCFYVIGSADCKNRHVALIKTNPPFLTEVSFNGGKPFFKIEADITKNRLATFYIGWRERGNFGIKLNTSKKKKIEEASPIFNCDSD